MPTFQEVVPISCELIMINDKLTRKWKKNMWESVWRLSQPTYTLKFKMNNKNVSWKRQPFSYLVSTLGVSPDSAIMVSSKLRFLGGTPLQDEFDLDFWQKSSLGDGALPGTSRVVTTVEQWKKTLVVWGIYGIILPSYMGIISNHFTLLIYRGFHSICNGW